MPKPISVEFSFLCKPSIPKIIALDGVLTTKPSKGLSLSPHRVLGIELGASEALTQSKTSCLVAAMDTEMLKMTSVWRVTARP